MPVADATTGDVIHDSPFGGNGALLMGLTWAQAFITTLVMLLRAYTNRYLTRQFGWSFVWALLTYVIVMLAQIFITVSASWGLGNRRSNLSDHEFSRAIVWSWAGQSLAILGIAFAKVAIVVFYLKLLGPSARRQRYFLLFIACSNVLVNVTQTVLVWNQCNPPKKLWEPDTPGSCALRRSVQITGFFHASWNALSDLMLAIYPAFFFWELNMRLRIKVGLCLLMGSGVIATGCACAKAYELRHVTQEQDITYGISTLVILALTEPWLVLITGSLPVLWPLMRIGLRKLSVSKESQSYKLSDKKSPLDSCGRQRGPPKTSEDFTELSTETGTINGSRTLRSVSKVLASLGGRGEQFQASRTESQDAMLPNDGIVVSQHVHVTCEARDETGNPPDLEVGRISRETDTSKNEVRPLSST